MRSLLLSVMWSKRAWRAVATAWLALDGAVAAGAQTAPTASVTAGATGATGATVGATTTLLHCTAGSGMACVQVTVPRALGSALDTSAASWKGTLGGSPLIGPGRIHLGFDPSRVIRLLIAVDISGSMRGEGIAFTRSALRSFVSAMPASGVEVAIVPFESHGVAQHFAAARFATKDQAARQLDALPMPTNGNTALYSAIAEGLRALDRPGGTPGATVLLVLTDGVNDVGHGTDDDGLLGGDAGREEARRLIAATAHRVWLVGVGSGVNDGELRTLAGRRATSSVVAMDPGALLSLLEQIRLSLASQVTVVYGLPSSVLAGLGRRPQLLAVHGDSTQLPGWRPPALARPLFAGIADSTLLSPDVRVLAASGAASGTDRVIVGLALLVVLLSAYAVLWRTAGSTPVATSAASPKPEKKAAPSAAALRRDITDAPPRAPTDITKDAAA
jgi:hypothetical protein